MIAPCVCCRGHTSAQSCRYHKRGADICASIYRDRGAKRKKLQHFSKKTTASLTRRCEVEPTTTITTGASATPSPSSSGTRSQHSNPPQPQRYVARLGCCALRSGHSCINSKCFSHHDRRPTVRLGMAEVPSARFPGAAACAVDSGTNLWAMGSTRGRQRHTYGQRVGATGGRRTHAQCRPCDHNNYADRATTTGRH